MPRQPSQSDFESVYQARVKGAREAHGTTQREMAELLGVELDTYKKYENRPGSTLPLHLVHRFCAITRTAPKALLAPPSARELAAIRTPARLRSTA